MRKDALDWWQRQTEFRKMDFFKKYPFFTPAPDYSRLTGREIEWIYTNMLYVGRVLFVSSIGLVYVKNQKGKTLICQNLETRQQVTVSSEVPHLLIEEFLENVKVYEDDFVLHIKYTVDHRIILKKYDL